MIKQIHNFILYLLKIFWLTFSFTLPFPTFTWENSCNVQEHNTFSSDISCTRSSKTKTAYFKHKTFGGFHKPLAIWWEIKLQKAIELVLRGDQHLWWMDGRWCYYSKYWTNTQQENELRAYLCVYVCARMQVGVCIQCWSCKYLPSLIIFIELL